MESPDPASKDTMFRITDIEFSNSQIDDKIVGIFRFESTGPMKRGPILLVLAEIEGVGYVYDQLIDVLNNEAEHSRNLMSSIETDPVTRFEKITQNINRAIKDFLEEESTPINWNRVNIFIIELSEGHLCLAGVGRLMNMFLQKQEDGSYRTYDLFGSLDQRVDIDPSKFFSNIICGDFKLGDILIAGSNNFERFRNELRMKERLTTLPPVTASLEIKQDLEARGIPDDFVATVIACKGADAPRQTMAAVPHEEMEKSTSSVEELRRTEEETARTLAPAIAPKEHLTEMSESEPPIGGGRFSFIGRIFGKVFGTIIGVVKKIFRREKVKDVANMVNLRGMHAGFGSFFTKRRKSLIIGVIALIIIVVVTGTFLKNRRTAAAEEAAWNSTYDDIQAIVERAEGETVYSEEKARKTLAGAVDILKKLDTNTPEREQAVATLSAQANEMRTKLQRVVNVSNPTELFALADGLADGALASPILFQGNLVVADRANEQLVVIDLESKEVSTVDLPEGRTRAIGIAAGRSSVIVMLQDRSLLAADIESGAVSNLSLGGAEASGVTDILSYANRLYVLDAGAEQIWRHPSASGGFGSGGKYLQASSESLSDAVSLAIDSNVYVLKANGIVVRYYSGGQDGFALSPIDPPLTNGNQIWADVDNDYVVIADEDGKRVAVFTKEGRLVGQYKSSVFKGPTDVVADPETKKLYVVDGNKVYELLLP
jgi:hypothetical protein